MRLYAMTNPNPIEVAVGASRRPFALAKSKAPVAGATIRVWDNGQGVG